jgi:Protein of unknown function (DUF3040)
MPEGGDEVPLSEDEQRILHEMEQKLYEHDRGFADRVRSAHTFHRPMRWSIGIFVAGLAIVLLSFSSSLLLATFGFLIMVFASLLFERGARHAVGGEDGSRSLGGDLSTMGRRLRSRFFQKH